MTEAADETDARVQLMRNAVASWTRHLVDLGGRNSLLWFRDLPTGTLDLTTAHPSGVAALMSGRPTCLSQLLREDHALEEGRRRARAIAGKARELKEERGIETAFVAFGMATWTLPNAESSRSPAAPVLLRSVTLRAVLPSQTDFVLDLGDEVELNPVLEHYLTSQVGITVDGDAIEAAAHSSAGFDPYPAYAALTQACAALPGFTISPRVVAGTFSYAKLPMVADLAAQGDTLADHEVVAALAGDPAALAAVQTPAEAAQPPLAIRDEQVRPDFLVLDADSSQEDVIEQVRAGRHLVVQGPPGTGKSQTIANLLATLAGDGRRVLFVAEKRAAIDAVVGRLDGVGLGDLVLDLHDGARGRRRVAQQVVDALDAPAPPPSAPQSVRERRDAALATLDTHAAAMHETRPPFDVTEAQVLEQVSALAHGANPPRTRVRFRGTVLAGLDRATFDRHRDELVRLAGLRAWAQGDQPGERADDDAWFGAGISSTQDAVRARDIVERLAGSGVDDVGDRVVAALNGLAVGPESTVREWGTTLTTLAAVRNTLETFRPEIFDEPLELAVAATAPRGALAERPGFWERRRIKAGVRRLLRPGPPPEDLHHAVRDAAAQRAAWRQLAGAGGRPEIPTDLDVAQTEHDVIAADLGWLDERLPQDADEPSLLDLDRAGLRRRLDVLAAQVDRLAVLPTVRGPLDELEAAGLGPLISDFAARGVRSDAVAAEADLAWWASIADEIAFQDKRIGGYSGEHLRAVAADYVALDRQVIADGAARVQAAVRRRVARVARAYPEQVARVRAEAARTRGRRTVRDLLGEAGEVLTAARPCWVMSPLVVASVLPPGRFFDVVVFDEASQIPPAEAVSAISRGHQVVLAGDSRQLPPTTFFSTVADDPEPTGSDPLTAGVESILDVLGAVLPVARLTWHYRSLDERLITFANTHVYDGRLVTFPGTGVDPVVTHRLVEGVGVVSEGGDAVESTGAEVDAVVELALTHARTRPGESLGVIALGLPHAQRVEDALRRALVDVDEATAAFFDESAEERFFVKNLERVQGDERDAVILTVGYGKTPHGRVLHRFGPLNLEGGERRLNVAITRARRRMTVVSSISAADLDPSRLRAKGAVLLREFLAYAASEPGPLVGASTSGETSGSGLVDELVTRLGADGASVRENLGSGLGRVEVAVADPQRRDHLLVAVESDGPAYAARPAGRDRERLRSEQLARLGWRTVRVHLLDLFRDPAQERSRVLRAVDEAAAPATGTDASTTGSDPGATGTDPRATGSDSQVRPTSPLRPA